MSKYKVWMLLVLCNLFWAGNYVFGKFVIAEMSPLWITFSRWLLALFLLFPVAMLMEKPDWKAVGRAWPNLVIMGSLGVIGYNLLLYSALEYTTATNAALVSALNPGVIVLFSVFLLGERISRIQTAGFALSLLGALVILTKGHLSQVLVTEYNQGDLLMIAGVIVWTLYSIVGRRLRAVPPITATAVSALFATVIISPFALYQGIDIGSLSSLAYTGIIYMAVFPSLFSFVFWNVSVRSIGASQAGVFLNLIPLFTAIISWLLGEGITGAQLTGGLLVFSGVYLATGMLDRKLADSTQRAAVKT